jgi:hypothetical protein
MLYGILSGVGKNRIYTPYMAVYLVIPLPKMPYIHRIYMVLANPNDILSCFGVPIIIGKDETPKTFSHLAEDHVLLAARKKIEVKWKKVKVVQFRRHKGGNFAGVYVCVCMCKCVPVVTTKRDLLLYVHTCLYTCLYTCAHQQGVSFFHVFCSRSTCLSCCSRT